MKILYLCSKKTYDTKMSRVRFHGIDAINKITDLVYSGKGWPNYDNSKTTQENIDKIYNGEQPDLVLAYKPLECQRFRDIKAPKCLRYNEMWNKQATEQEIIHSSANLVVCHHLNDMPNYAHLSNVKFVNISHCAEQTIYKDYGEKKTTDILFVGASGKHYAFRGRLLRIMGTQLTHMVKCKIIAHPGGVLGNVHGVMLKDYAREINRSKITLTGSSNYKYRLGKYTEIPMSGSLLAADLPNEDHDFFRQFMLVLDPSMSDGDIVHQLVKYIKNDEIRNKKIQKGLELNKEYTQEKYAERFVKEAQKFLYENICK